MSQSIKNETLGLELNVLNVPETVQEFDQQAGSEGSCLAEAVKNVIYRNWNPKFRKAFSKALAEATEETHGFTGVARRVVGQGPARKDGTKPDIYESESKHFENVKKTTGKPTLFFQSLAEKVAAEIPFDPKEATRGSGRVGKEYLELADGVLEYEDDRLQEVVARLSELNPTHPDLETDDDGKPTRESLAGLIRANVIRKAQEDL